ncbi:hypothetical protein SAMN05444267_104830 [Chryseobacterium polytrichastri]|uniref:Uncharacterized protein n=2 Tax=Chryseobacterium polytrichastri TaxID=1302687 RepID=A0A1M7IVC6_9FLAO|nr:hypothetical protein SAMN05444267_104830 [Chryseobacterium polytrichastri]
MDSFTWSINDEISNITNWGCYECGYQAIENEVNECACENCRKKQKTKLKDSETEYWWCSHCNEITQE